MSNPAKLAVSGTFTLPPLILHPFTESATSVQVLESAKASLALLRDGSAPAERAQELDSHVLQGRYAEMRMLFYVGKDVFRWMDQCLDHCTRLPVLEDEPLANQSFSHLLIKQTPRDVADKLRGWGVVEYARIFSRAIGIFTQFSQPPSRDTLNDDYLRSYYRYADYAHYCWRDMRKYPVLPEEQFLFTLYASGEYTKLLEEQWERSKE